MEWSNAVYTYNSENSKIFKETNSNQPVISVSCIYFPRMFSNQCKPNLNFILYMMLQNPLGLYQDQIRTKLDLKLGLNYFLTSVDVNTVTKTSDLNASLQH